MGIYSGKWSYFSQADGFYPGYRFATIRRSSHPYFPSEYAFIAEKIWDTFNATGKTIIQNPAIV